MRDRRRERENVRGLKRREGGEKMEGGAVGKAATNFLSLVYLQIVLPFYRPY